MEIRKGVIKLLPEDNPADLYPHAQCDVCGGTIKQNWDDKGSVKGVERMRESERKERAVDILYLHAGKLSEV